MLPTPSFVKEITVTIKDLLETTLDPVHQADAVCRDRAFQEDICSSKIQILKRPYATNNCSYQTEPTATSKTGCTVYQKTPIVKDDLQLPITVYKTQKPVLTARHSKRIDQQDSLQKMKQELEGKTMPTPLSKTVKKILA